MKRVLAALATAVAVALVCAPARAQGSDASVASELFTAGRDLLKAGKYSEACPKLAESARLDPRVGTLARLAECEEKLGHLARARGFWQQAVNLARAQHDDRHEHVEQEFRRLDSVVPKLALTFAGAVPDGFEVRIDDTSVGAGGLGVPLPVESGAHTIAASAKGKARWSTTVETKNDGAVTNVEIPTLVDEPASIPPPVATVAVPPKGVIAEPPPAPTSSMTPLRIAALGTGGAGILGLGIGVAFAVRAKSLFDASNVAGGCVGDVCPSAAAGKRNDALTAGNVATALLVSGGVLTAAGVVLWIVAPPTHARAPHAVRLLPCPSPEGVTVNLTGRF